MPQPHRHALLFVAWAFLVAMLGTTLPTPLYPIYQQRIGLSELMVTVIYASYAGGVIAALILVGRWSDQLGRRPMLFAGLAVSAASAAVFLAGSRLEALFVGRVLSGVSAAIFTGTATVALIELAPEAQRSRATLIATAANMGGLGLGPLVAGLLAEYAPLPIRLPFYVDLLLIAIAAVGVWLAPETVQVAARPQLGPQRLQVPQSVRPAFVPAAIAGFAGFAVLGLFTAVAPSFLGRLLNLPNHALIGAVVFGIFAASTAGQALLGRMPRRYAFPGGCVVLMLGMALLAAAIDTASLAMLIAAALVAGLGQGVSFRAGLAAVTEASPPGQRAEITSTFFIVIYVAISVPVIGVGLMAERYGLRHAGIAFAAAMGLLAAIALVLIVLRRARAAPRLAP
jgi:MFS family permease